VYKPEFDEVLTRHLGRVAAPEELWERIENPGVSARVPTRHARVRAPRALLAVAAAMVIMAVVFHPRRELPSDFRSQAARARIIGARVVEGAVEVEYRLPEHNIMLRVLKAEQAQEALNAACFLCHTGV
jgi:hypothetical protein